MPVAQQWGRIYRPVAGRISVREVIILAPAELPEAFVAWNKRWGAPFGRRFQPWSVVRRVKLPAVRLIGPFAFQGNSITRTFEYPWTYSELPVTPGARLLEIGGALSGLQFVLAKQGAEVHNVDPLWDYGSGEYAVSLPALHARINRYYGTAVTLHQSTLPECESVGSGFDAIYSVSTIEHMSQASLEMTLSRASELLKPGGLMVFTVDLFLNLIPFSPREHNEYGSNVSIAWIQQQLPGFRLASGCEAELFGYPEFSSEDIQSNLERFVMNGPQLAQAVTFQKPGL